MMENLKKQTDYLVILIISPSNGNFLQNLRYSEPDEKITLECRAKWEPLSGIIIVYNLLKKLYLDFNSVNYFSNKMLRFISSNKYFKSHTCLSFIKLDKKMTSLLMDRNDSPKIFVLCL